MKFESFKPMAQKAYEQAKPLAQTAMQKTKETLAYCKQNPQDGFLAVMAVCGVHQSMTVEAIEDNTEVSAIVDIHEFMGS